MNRRASGAEPADPPGRRARRPGEIPARGWRDVLARIWSEIQDDHLTLIAAGVAFYAMLAVFPGVVALVSWYALVADPEQIRAQLKPLTALLPDEAGQLLVDRLAGAAAVSGNLTLGLVVSLLTVLWSVSNGVAALITGLNVIYDARETRSFVRLRGMALLFTAAVLVTGTLVLALVALFPVAIDLIGLGGARRFVANVARWTLLVLLAGATLTVLYRFGPDRAPARWRWLSWGVVLALLLWLLGSALFSLYVTTFGRYGQTYGALAGVVVLLLWLYLSAFAVLLGAEVDAEVEHQTAVDSTTGRPRPMGLRGAVMADTLGESADHPDSAGGRTGSPP